MPARASVGGGISGTVKDLSGAVIPKVLLSRLGFLRWPISTAFGVPPVMVARPALESLMEM